LADGSITWYGFNTDITDRKRVEDALRASEELLNATQHLTKVGGWEWNVETQTMYWTEETYLIHDFVPSEMVPGSAEHIGRSLECYAPEDRPLIRAAFQRCVEEGQAYDFDFPFTTGKGRRLWIQTTAQPVLESGRVIRVIGNIMDITERKRAEQELLLKNLIFEASITANSIADIKGILTHANSSFIRMWGYENKEEVIGKPISDFLKFEHETRKIITALNENNEWTGEYTDLRRDGTTFNAYTQATIVMDESGNTIGYQSTVLDITERKQAEERIHASLREKELLLLEVHHRTKNNMQVISGLLDLQARSSGNPELIERLNESQSRIRSMALIHEKLYGSKDFARVDLVGYVRSLSQELFQSCKINPGEIDLIVQTDGDVYVDINKAIPCGLILN